MHRLNELAEKLSPSQLKEVEDFAEFLVARNAMPSAGTSAADYVDVQTLVGLCEGMGGDKTDKELVREAWNDIVAKALG